MKVLLHNEAIRQPLVIEIGENDAGIPLFDARHEAEAFLLATFLGSDWEAVELPDGEAADVLESFGDPVGAPGHEDEYDKAISWVILNPPPRTGQEGGADVGSYLVALLEYARTLRTQGHPVSRDRSCGI